MITKIVLGGKDFAVDLYGCATLSREDALAQTGLSLTDVTV